MSEQVPRSNPRLDNFETTKAQTEQEEFEQSLYGDAGTTDFSDEARRRVEEADEYERYMEQMANRPNHDLASAEGAAERRVYSFADLNDEASPAYERELEALVATTREQEQRERAEREAFAAKIEESPILRMADKISREIQELRVKIVNPETVEADQQRIKDLEDRLEGLLDRYTRSDGHDLAVAEFMINRDYEGARDRNKVETPVDSSDEEETPNPDSRTDQPTDEEAPREDDDPDEHEDDHAEDPFNPDASRSGDEPVIVHDDNEEAPEEDVDFDAREDDLIKPVDYDPNAREDEPVVKPSDLPPAPAFIYDDDDRAALERELIDRKRIDWKNPVKRLHVMFTNQREYFRNTDRKTKIRMVLAAAAGVALVTVGVLAARHGNHGATTGLADLIPPVTPPKGELGSYVEAVTPSATSAGDLLTPVNGTLPELGSHAHLWGWAADAFGPENATKALHAMTDRAEAAGHVVEWHGSGKEQWVRVDGNTGVKNLYDALVPFAK